MIKDEDNHEVISSELVEVSKHEYEDGSVEILDDEINVSGSGNESQTSPEYFAYNVTDDKFLHDSADYHQE